jgi:uncharacterized protein (TIGR02117 family)
LLAPLVALLACAQPPRPNVPATLPLGAVSFYVVHDSWHSAVVLRVANLSAEVFPEINHFPSAQYLEFSWGDRDYFPHPHPGIGLALKAAFWSGGSVLHVVPLHGEPAAVYPQAQVLPLTVARGDFEQLVRFISHSFDRAEPQTAAEARPGLTAESRFYPSVLKFSILRTCNTWVAEALRAANLPIDPKWVISAGSLGRQVSSVAASRRAEH